MGHSTTGIPFRRAGGVMEPCGALWPNGEFTIGYSPCGGLEREMTAKEYADKWTPPIGLAIGPNSHRAEVDSRKSRGLNGMTPYGKRLLRNSVEMLERVYGVRNLSFVTLTIPDITNDELREVNANWSEIIRVYYQSLGRCLSRACLPAFYAGCTEVQPERSQSERRPVLHVHHIVVGRRRGQKGWGLPPSVFRECWSRAVCLYLRNEYDWTASERVEGVKWSAAAYIAKYFTKHQGKDPHSACDYSYFPMPSAWFNIALNLKRAVAKRVRKDSTLMDTMEKMCRSGMMDGFCDFYYSGSVDAMSGPGPHYFVGKLKPNGMKWLIEYWRTMRRE